MNIKTITRLLLFFIALPLILALIIVLPFSRHLALNLLAIGVSVIGALELNALLGRRSVDMSAFEAVIAGLLLPAAALVDLFLGLPFTVMMIALWIGLCYVLSKPIFRTDRFETIIPTMTADILLLVYPGFFLAFLILLSRFANSTVLISVFVLMVFGNDSIAYVSGRLFGKKRNIIPISPNKSVAGFIGGFLTSFAVAIVAWLIFPDVFGASPAGSIVSGFVVGVTTILGDLIESALKRSASAKDSGTIVPGRGGILDSIDSMLFSVPFYYLVCEFFFK
jgi:phosphatidate cytidylyltransferase